VVFDCGEIGPLYVFCAVVAWSRVRFVSFADNLGAEVAMTALAECFECVGGVPKTALTDRSCLNGGTVAGLVIPTPANVRFATHYRFRPDFCEGADPESKDLVEKLVGYVESDLMIPEQLTVSHLGTANAKGRLWLDEVNGAVHSEISAIPAERLASERELFSELPTLRATIGKVVTRKVDRLSCVRLGSARYSVPDAHVGGTVELRIRDGWSPWCPAGTPSPKTWSFPLVRRRSSTITTADRDRVPCGRSGPGVPTRRPSVLSARRPQLS